MSIILVLLIALFWPLVVALQYKWQHGKNVKILFYPFLGFFKFRQQSLQQYGDVMTIFDKIIKQNPVIKIIVSNFGFNVYIYIVDEQYAKQSLINHDFYKKIVMSPIQKELELGLARQQGNEWKKQRQFYGQVFTFQNIINTIPIIKQIAEQIIPLIPCDIPIIIEQEIQKITAEVVFQTFFGCTAYDKNLDGKPIHQELTDLLRDSHNLAILTPFYQLKSIFFGANKAWQIFQTKPEKELIQRIDNYNSLTKQIILQRLEELQKEKNFKNNILDMFLQQYIQQVTPNLTIDIILSQFFTIFSAGMDTTATLITNCCYFLSNNIDIQDKLRKQINDSVKDSKEIDIKLLQSDNLQLLQNCIQETLRLLPPAAYSAVRTVTKNHKINQFELVKNQTVIVGIVHIQRREEIFENSLEFQPSRWDNVKHFGFNFIPFSIGSRNCIGQHLALIEAKIILIQILKKFQLIFNKNQSYSKINMPIYHVSPGDFIILQKLQ